MCCEKTGAFYRPNTPPKSGLYIKAGFMTSYSVMDLRMCAWAVMFAFPPKYEVK